MAGYPKSLSQRLGERALAKRRPLAPEELALVEILEIITSSPAAAKTLLANFPSLRQLADYGAENGFVDLYGQPGITTSVIAKLESWLESIGRVLFPEDTEEETV